MCFLIFSLPPHKDSSSLQTLCSRRVLFSSDKMRFHLFFVDLVSLAAVLCDRVSMKEELCYTCTCQVLSFCICLFFIQWLILTDRPSVPFDSRPFSLPLLVGLLSCTLKLSKLYCECHTSSLP